MRLRCTRRPAATGCSGDGFGFGAFICSAGSLAGRAQDNATGCKRLPLGGGAPYRGEEARAQRRGSLLKQLAVPAFEAGQRKSDAADAMWKRKIRRIARVFCPL